MQVTDYLADQQMTVLRANAQAAVTNLRTFADALHALQQFHTPGNNILFYVRFHQDGNWPAGWYQHVPANPPPQVNNNG